MTQPNDSAFPVQIMEGINYAHGLSIREYYAGMAMQGLLANATTDPEGLGANQAKSYASDAVYMADALIAELNKTK